MPLTVPGVVQVGNGAKWLTPGAGATSVKVKVDGIETTFAQFRQPRQRLAALRRSRPGIHRQRAHHARRIRRHGHHHHRHQVRRQRLSTAALFWYLRNSATDARNTFATVKPFQNLHNYGGTIGGPIRKDKTFFFFDFDGSRAFPRPLFTPNVPTLAMRQGDFSGLRRPQESLHRRQSLQRKHHRPVVPQLTGAQGQKLFFPLPNFGAPTSPPPTTAPPSTGPKCTAPKRSSLDHNFSPTHTGVFLRYENRKDDYDIPGARSALPPTTVGTSDNIRRVNFWTARRRLDHPPEPVNEFRAGVVILVSASSGQLTGQPLMDQIGIQGLPDRGTINNLPFFSVISGFTSNTINLLNPVNDGHAQFADNLSWMHGRHTMKFGIEEVSWFVNRFMPNTSGNPRSSAAIRSPANSPATPTPISCSACPPPSPAWNRTAPRTSASATGPSMPRTISKSPRQPHPDVRPALGIQRPRLHPRRQHLFLRPRLTARSSSR